MARSSMLLVLSQHSQYLLALQSSPEERTFPVKLQLDWGKNWLPGKILLCVTIAERRGRECCLSEQQIFRNKSNRVKILRGRQTGALSVRPASSCHWSLKDKTTQISEMFSIFKILLQVSFADQILWLILFLPFSPESTYWKYYCINIKIYELKHLNSSVFPHVKYRALYRMNENILM